MKKIILFLLISLTANKTFAQEVTKIPLVQDVVSEWYTFKNNDDTILVQNYKDKKEKGYLITILDSNDQTKKLHKIAETKDVLINASFDDNTVYFLFQKSIKEESTIIYYVKMVSLTDFNETKKTLFTVIDNNSDSIRRFLKVNPNSMFGEVVVEDSEYTSIIYNIRTKESKTRTAYLFDRNYNQIFKKSNVYSRDRDKRFEIISSFIDKTNQQIVVLNIKRDSNEYLLESINGNEFISKDVSFKKNGQRDLRIVNSENGFHIVGFFSDKEKENEDALLYTSFSEDLKLLEEKYIKLSKEFFDSLNKKQKKRGMLLNLHSVLIDDFDNAYIIGEAQKIAIKGRDMDGFNNRYGIPDDVVVCKIDENGSLLWSKLVNKSQKFYKTQYGSFRAFLMDNKLHYVFNSEMKLKDVKTDKVSGKSMQPGSGQRFSVYLVSFNKDGDFEHFKLTDKKVDLRYMTTNSGLIKNESMLLFGTRKGEHGILKIKF